MMDMDANPPMALSKLIFSLFMDYDTKINSSALFVINVPLQDLLYVAVSLKPAKQRSWSPHFRQNEDCHRQETSNVEHHHNFADAD
jgi:hypothetical protein